MTTDKTTDATKRVEAFLAAWETGNCPLVAGKSKIYSFNHEELRHSDLTLVLSQLSQSKAEIERLTSLKVAARALARCIDKDAETQAIIEVCEAIEAIDTLATESQGD